MPNYSISVRLRRVITEEAYVKVPVTDELIVDGHLDGQKVFAEAVRLGGAASTGWHPESYDVLVHPVQQPPDPYFD